MIAIGFEHVIGGVIIILISAAVLGIFKLNGKFIQFEATIKAKLDAFEKWTHSIDKRVNRLEELHLKKVQNEGR